MAEELGLEELQAHALNNIGVSRLGMGDRGAIEDLERSIEISDAINSVESARAYGNLASSLVEHGELERSAELLKEAYRRAERFGLDDWLLWLRGEMTWPPYYSGDWDEAFRQLDELIGEFLHHPFWMESPCRVLRGRMRLARGDAAGAREDADRALELARAAKDPQVLWPALALSARLLVPSDAQGANALLGELLSEWQAGSVVPLQRERLDHRCRNRASAGRTRSGIPRRCEADGPAFPLAQSGSRLCLRRSPCGRRDLRRDGRRAPRGLRAAAGCREPRA